MMFKSVAVPLLVLAGSTLAQAETIQGVSKHQIGLPPKHERGINQHCLGS